MKALPSILAAAFLIAASSLATAAGDTTAKPGISKRGDDTNPSVPGNGPSAGNSSYKKAMHARRIRSAPVSARAWHPKPHKP